MNENSLRAFEILEEARVLAEGDEQIALCDSAVREADLGGEVDVQYAAREELVRASVFGGEPDRAIVAFAWMLATFDKYPHLFDEWNLLWKYKWILGLLCDFPQISRARIFEMLEDLEQRSRKAGYGLRAAYTHRYRIEKFWDNRAAAIESFLTMQKLPIDDLSNCVACDLDEKVEFMIYCQEYDTAVNLAQPLLNGAQKCRTVPHRTYAKLLLPMIKLGRQQEALDYHRAGYLLVDRNKENLDRVSEHIFFLVLTENFARALELFQKHYAWTVGNRNQADIFRFSRTAFFFSRFWPAGQTKPLLSRYPSRFRAGRRTMSTNQSGWRSSSGRKLKRWLSVLTSVTRRISLCAL